MAAIVGVVIFALGVLAGLWMAGVVLFVIHQIASDLAVKPEPETATEPLSVPVVEIPVTLDAERVVAVGFSRALQEEAGRIARLN